jgi:hypothetical protein
MQEAPAEIAVHLRMQVNMQSHLEIELETRASNSTNYSLTSA